MLRVVILLFIVCTIGKAQICSKVIKLENLCLEKSSPQEDPVLLTELWYEYDKLMVEVATDKKLKDAFYINNGCTKVLIMKDGSGEILSWQSFSFEDVTMYHTIVRLIDKQKNVSIHKLYNQKLPLDRIEMFEENGNKYMFMISREHLKNATDKDTERYMVQLFDINNGKMKEVYLAYPEGKPVIATINHDKELIVNTNTSKVLVTFKKQGESNSKVVLDEPSPHKLEYKSQNITW